MVNVYRSGWGSPLPGDKELKNQSSTWATDFKNKTQDAYAVLGRPGSFAKGFPNYVLIDRAGKIRFSGRNVHLERELAPLFKEKAQKK